MTKKKTAKKKTAKKKTAKKKTVKKSADPSPLPEYIRSTDLAFMFDVTPRRIERMVSEDGMPKSSRGSYNLVECVRWYVNFWRDKSSNTGDAKNEKRLNLIEAQTEKTIVETEKLREKLLPIEEVAHTLNAIAVIVATQLDGLGPRMANTLSGIDEPAEIQRALFNECRTIRENIADQIEDLATIENVGLDSSAAA